MFINDAIQFEKNLYALINSCGLPVDTAFFVLKSVYLDFQNTLNEYAKTENDEKITEKTTEITIPQESKKFVEINNNKEITENDDTVNRDNA